MLNGLKPLSRSLRWGMVGGGEPVRSATATAVRRCVTMFIPCWPARLTSMPSAGARSVSNWASRRALLRRLPDPVSRRGAAPDGIEVVSVTTPNNTHFAITKAALEAGLHVICEKPLCFTAEEARELVELSKNRTKSSASPTAMPAIR